MARTAQLVVLGLVLAALLQTAQAATDKSAACQAALAACEAKCTGYDFQFSCSARHKPDGPRCRCTKLLQAESAPQIARLELIHWPGAEACNQLTWANDCGGNLAAAIDGTSVTLTPAVAPAFKALCPASAGVAIGQGSKAQAAVAFPQHPVGVVSAKPDGTVTFDFTRAASDDADWSKCMLTYRVAEGSFLQAGTSSQSSSLQAASQSFQGFQSSLGAKQVSAQKTTTPNNRGLIVSTSVLGGVAAALALGNLFDLK